MFSEDRLCGLDFETYGSVNLPSKGLANYTRDPYFQPLIARLVNRRAGTLLETRCDFVQSSPKLQREKIGDHIGNRYIVAHNAIFEKKVLHTIGLHYPASRFIDSAVIARAAGAGGKLEAAGPQLLGINKMAEGWDLIKLFSIPGKYQEKYDTEAFVPEIIEDHPDEWQTFGQYCGVDARLGLDIALDWDWVLTEGELDFSAITLDMNETGWHVDVSLVQEMQRRYEENMSYALDHFRAQCDAPDLNLNSLKQLKEWCFDRGVKTTSFDEKHVESLLTRMDKKLFTMGTDDPKFDGYMQVRMLLATKQTLGGSSLKKLATIANNVSGDRLIDQYLHIGAAQTWRTTGRSVQMQNLKQLGDEPADMSELEDPEAIWDNAELARNLRQVFTATDENGALIVGDFSSVESRGLAYQAGAEWKLRAFRSGKDMYKVLAEKMFHIPYDEVMKEQRKGGKVGELSCGYQAGPGAVQDFAKKMSIEMSEGEASKLVNDWREVNPEIVAYWWKLDEMLHAVLDGSPHEIHVLPHDKLVLKMKSMPAPDSLSKQVGRQMRTLVVEIFDGSNQVVLRRFFHGIYARGRNVCYFKPSELKSGDLWKIDYVDQKTKQRRLYEIYGGKLAGILTQSLCREIFFRSLRRVHGWVLGHSNIQLVGQFHDEIVLDWAPGGPGTISLDEAKQVFEELMSDAKAVGFPSFPLGADIKHDYRYTK